MNLNRTPFAFQFALLLALSLFTSDGSAQVSALSDRFTGCVSAISSLWLTYSVTGNQKWDCNNQGFQDNCAYMNGYANSMNNANEDWLISPKLDLHSYYMPNLEMVARTKYSGNALQVFYSTNYSGSGNPNSATWTALNITLPASNSDYWMTCRYNLTGIKGTPCYIGFKYTSTTSAAASWKLDNIRITDSCNTKFILCGDVAPNSTGNGKSFQFIKSQINSTLQLSVNAPFELSKDNVNYSSSITYTSADANTLQTAYVRIHPVLAKKEYRASVLFNYETLTQGTEIRLFGSSIDPTKSIKMASWNMRWFGYPSMCACDTQLARQNALKVIQHLGADLYLLEEVVEKSQLRSICNQLGPDYKCLISEFTSFAQDSSDSQYPTGQKLAFLYNSQKIQSIQSFGLLKSTYPSNNNPYYCFSSGRFPYVLKAKISFSNLQDTVVFVGIHAKADNTTSDYQRRECGSLYMTDSLNALFPNNKIVIMGDYNDYLEGSTVSGQSVTPYHDLLNGGFQGISLPSIYPNVTTFSGSDGHLIDNLTCSTEAIPYYVDSSFTVLKEMEDIIDNYAQTTSDHFPILAYLQFPNPSSSGSISKNESEFHLVSPSSNSLILLDQAADGSNVQVDVMGLDGSINVQKQISSHSSNSIACPEITPGLYLVRVIKNNQPTYFKWLVIP